MLTDRERIAFPQGPGSSAARPAAEADRGAGSCGLLIAARCRSYDQKTNQPPAEGSA